MLFKLCLSLTRCGLSAAAGLLATNHPGLGIKVTNYSFLLLTFAFLLKLAKNE